MACRAAILGSLLRDPATKEERRKLLDFMVEFCKWEASNRPEFMEEAKRLILRHNRGSAPRILDCFAGGGSIPLEGLRVGCEVSALELNPVALIVELCTITYPQRYGKPFRQNERSAGNTGVREVIANRLAYDVERWSEWILSRVRRKIGQFYSQGPGEPLGYFWARTIGCINSDCRSEIPLVRQLWLRRSDDRKIALRMIPRRKEKRVDFEIAEGHSFDYDPTNGTMRYGSVECPVCKTSMSGEYIKAQSNKGNVRFRLLALATSAENGKTYRIAKEQDRADYQSASEELKKLMREAGSTPIVPDEEISRDWPRTILLPLYGFNKWGQLFNDRQLLCLSSLTLEVKAAYKEILKENGDPEYSKAVATYLALAIDRLANQNSTQCVWVTNGEKIAGSFGRQALPMVWDFVEANPLGKNTWSFESHVGWILEVIDFCSKSSNKAAECQHGTATRLPYPDGYFDAVITDPPYYSAVPYADLSDFFYVWLKRSIGFLYPELFATPLSPKSAEIVEQMRHSSLVNRKDKVFFEREMTKALTETCRVLKTTGIATVVFAHKTTSAWEALIEALLNSGLAVTSSWPLHTERPGRLRAQESAALASSVWLVCRKRDPGVGISSWKIVQAELDKKVRERLDYFLEQGIRGADALLSAIGPALEVFGKYQKVEKVTGDSVKISEFLDKVREVVAHHALSTVLSQQELGNVDPPTAFYVLWRWTFEPTIQNAKLSTPDAHLKGDGNHILVPYDEALKLAHSVGANPEALLRTHLVRQEKENVRLLGPIERKNVSSLGETAHDGALPTIIDMIHRAVNLWSSQEYANLDEYLGDSGAMTNDTFWRVAQALSNLLPMQSREKQLLDGLLARHEGEAEIVPQGVKTLDEYAGKESKR